MTANEFVKKYGLEHAKYLLEDTELTEFYIHSTCAGKYYEDTVSVDELKRLIESHELVEKWGGLDDAKVAAKSGRYYGYLKKAIADVESCHV